MAIQVYAIDPDVWKASTTDSFCQTAVLDIWSKNKYAVALDGADVEMEYVDLLDSRTLGGEMRKILQDIFNQRERSARVRVVSPYTSSEFESKLAKLNCTTPVEPALIAMAASPTEPRIALLLIGEDAIRQRSLHKRNVGKELKRFFHDQLSRAFRVTMVRRDIGLDQKGGLIHGLHSGRFEDQVRSILMQRVYEKFDIMPQFLPSRQKYLCPEKPDIGEVEFDCYVFLDFGGTRHVWIAECELKEEGNEEKKTSKSKVKQLEDQLTTIEFFERERTTLPVLARGYLTTNAEGIESRAAQSVQAQGIQFISIRMPIDWTTNMHWTLQEKDFPSCSI